MREAVYEEKHEGLSIKIYQDDDSITPGDDRDAGLFLVGYHSDFTVDHSFRVDGQKQGGINQALAQVIANGGKNEDNEVEEIAMEYHRKYHIFGLEAYIHSGVVLALSREGNFCDRQWDVSQLGLVFVSKAEWKTRIKAREAALGLIETWNDYLSGNVYGYIVEDPNGNHLDSCWGFYGDYNDYALKEARSIAEYHYKDLLKKRANKTKAYIKNNVPLNNRVCVI